MRTRSRVVGLATLRARAYMTWRALRLIRFLYRSGDAESVSEFISNLNGWEIRCGIPISDVSHEFRIRDSKDLCRSLFKDINEETSW